MKELSMEEMETINGGHWWTAINGSSGMWDGIKMGAAEAGETVAKCVWDFGKAALSGEMPLY